MLTEHSNGCYGLCPDCGVTHSLGIGESKNYARALMNRMTELGRLDVDVPQAEANPALTLEHLFPGDRGHMFGVLECVDSNQHTIWLKAFSSLRGGVRHVPGWVRPNISQRDYERIIDPQEAKIKSVSGQWETERDPVKKANLAQERAQLSRSLWRQMKSLYRFHNFAGRTATLDDLFQDKGVPGGTGECCAPKLLCEAALRGLTPVGLSEFYWGPSTEYDGKTEGSFYPCCEPRCRPLLGFILCHVHHPDHRAPNKSTDATQSE